MPNRIIKESIYTSPNLNRLSDLAERHFYRLLPQPDDYGCFECTAKIIKGKCYPDRDEGKNSGQIKVTPELIEAWHTELEKAEIIVRWKVSSGREYAAFINWWQHQRVRSLHQRKTPVPPPPIAAICRQAPAIGALNPNPNPKHNPKPNPPYSPPLVKGGRDRGKSRKQLTDEIYADPKHWGKFRCTRCDHIQRLPFDHDRQWRTFCGKCKVPTTFQPIDESEGMEHEETTDTDGQE